MTLNPVRNDQGAVIGASDVTRSHGARAESEQHHAAVRADLESRIVAGAAQLRSANSELRRQIKARERLAGRLITLQDEERRRLGRELHDSTAQNLVALDMNLAHLERSADATARELTDTLADSRALVAESLREVRTLSYLLHPPLLDESGLASAIRWYADGFARRSGIAVTTEIDPTLGRLAREAEMALFRITQECLTNVHRHAASPTVAIRLKKRPTAVILEVEDAGHGMTAEHLVDTGRSTIELGVGISGMRERVRRLGGQLIIASSVTGTSVRATLPLSAAGLAAPRRKPSASEPMSDVG
jgi:signal transduction histidine kinase